MKPSRGKMSLAERRFGTTEKPRKNVTLTAGAWSVDFVAGGLRTLRYQGHEVLRAIAYLVRDANWGTYNPEITDCTVHQGKDQFAVSYRARCASGDPDQSLAFQARITGDAQGKIVFEVVAEPLTPFLTARCGFAVLHPIDGVAGGPALIEHVDGSLVRAEFPDLISPAQPFKNIRAIQHLVTPALTARCCLNGDVFEMEDQRNWSDASYKTYVRPLGLPWPYVMEQGVTNRQSVELEVKRSPGSSPGPAAGRAKPGTEPIRIAVRSAQGAFPGIGVSIHPDLIAEALAHPSLLENLRPQQLLFHFAPGAGHGLSHLQGFAEIARGVPAKGKTESVLELVLPIERSVREELSAVAEMVSAAGLSLSAILVSPAPDLKSTLPGTPWPPCPPLEEVYQAAREIFPGRAIGGGTLSYFTELNRKRPPVELLDFVSHCTCPIVHAADDQSVMQSLEALPHICRSTRAIIGDAQGYHIGPATIGMRHNPYGARVMPNPGNLRIPMTDRDPRQTSLFAAAWMIGYAAATAGAGLQTLTVGELTGSLGLAMAGAGGELVLHPAFYSARGLAELGGHPRYRCYSSSPATVAALAGVDRGGKRVVWLANLTGHKQQASVQSDHPIDSVSLLDESSLSEHVVESARPIRLLPYAVACLRLQGF